MCVWQQCIVYSHCNQYVVGIATHAESVIISDAALVPAKIHAICRCIGTVGVCYVSPLADTNYRF